MKNTKIIEVLRLLRMTHPLTNEERSAIAWTIGKLYKEIDSD